MLKLRQTTLIGYLVAAVVLIAVLVGYLPRDRSLPSEVSTELPQVTPLRQDAEEGLVPARSIEDAFSVEVISDPAAFKVTIAPELLHLVRSEKRLREVIPFVAGFEISSNMKVVVDTGNLDWISVDVLRRSPSKTRGVSLEDRSGPAPAVKHAFIGKQKYARVFFQPVRSEDSGEPMVASGSFTYSVVAEEEPQPSLMQSAPLLDPETDGDCVCSRIERDEVLPEPTGHPDDFARRRAGEEVNAEIRIAVHQTGIHKLTRQTLLAAGIPANALVGEDFRMFYRDREMAIHVNRPDLFTEDEDYLLFFAEGLSTYYTEENAVWLGFGPGGLRWEDRDTSPLPEPIEEQSHACMRMIFDEHQVAVQENFVLLMNQWGMPREGFDGFGLGIASGSGAVALFTGASDHVTDGSPQKIWARVRSVPGEHELTLKTLEGVSLQSIVSWTFSGAQRLQLEAVVTNKITAANALLHFEDTGVDGAASLMEEVGVEVERELYLFNGALGFGAGGGERNIRLEGIAETNEMVVLDVTDIWEPVRCINGVASEQGAMDRWMFSHTNLEARCYFSVEGLGRLAVSEFDVEWRSSRFLGDSSRTADYLVITPDIFETDVRRLLDHRDYNGLEVCVAPVRDVYNEFGYGVEGPEAIKQLIGYAFHHWREAPQMVLLVGDGRYNPLETVDDANNPNWIPVPMGAAADTWTAFDSWYVSVNGSDRVADLALGRLPVETVEVLGRLVDRIRGFEAAVLGESRGDASSWRRAVTLSADNGVEGFDIFSEELRTSVLTQTNLTVSTAYLNDSASNKKAVKTIVKAAFNNGSFAVSYMGHGGNESWAEQEVMDPATIQSLVTPGNEFPIVTVFTCLNGAFHQHKKPGYSTFEETESLAETFLRSEHGGAVAVMAPSGRAIANYSQQGALGFYEALVLNRYTIGMNGTVPVYQTRDTRYLAEAQLNMLTRMFLTYGSGLHELSLYTLFGDPALIVDPEPLGGAL